MQIKSLDVFTFDDTSFVLLGDSNDLVAALRKRALSSDSYQCEGCLICDFLEAWSSHVMEQVFQLCDTIGRDYCQTDSADPDTLQNTGEA